MFATKSRRLIASTVLLLSSVSVAAAQRILADISGTWVVSAQSPTGASESTAVFKQDADTLSGTIESQTLGSAKLSGTVKGDTVRFAFTIAVQGTQYELKAIGSVKDKDNIAGSLEAPNGVANFPFTMKRIP